MNVPLLYWASDDTWPGHPGRTDPDQTWPGHPGGAADQHGQPGGRGASRTVPSDPRFAAAGRRQYCQAASRIVAALAQTCAPPPASPSNTLLLHGTQNRDTNQAVDEGNLWGDYFYLESLTRLSRPDWTPYW